MAVRRCLSTVEQSNGDEGKPIKTPQKDFDKLAYWAGMAMRALLSSYVRPTREEMREIAALSWEMAFEMLDVPTLDNVR